MKKLFIIFTILLLFTSISYAASYKINSNGKITTKNNQNKPANQPVNIQQNNYYNNYISSDYINNKQVNVNPVGIIDIVMDFSSSMSNWVKVAKYSMASIVSQLPDSTKIGLRTFGESIHNSDNNKILGNVKQIVKSKKQKYKISADMPSYLDSISNYCNSSRQLAKVDYKNTTALINSLNLAEIGASTPLTLGLHQAVNIDFSGFSKANKKKIILITDGEETCGGNPCAFAAELMKKRNDIVIDVVLVSSSSKALKCLADTTGGKFYNIADDISFINVLQKSVTEPPEDNIQNNPNPTDSIQNYEYVEN